MGGAVSTGEDNDDLIDNLIEADCIKSPSVEAVFRAVDRGHYYLKMYREGAYKDVAWKHGNLHISAPCIYSEVMEALNLEPGLSFLNIGSGTGYINTMAGLILGSYGVNHGIELYQDVVNHACEFLEEFKGKSSSIDRYDFGEPQYFCGNVLLLDPTTNLYDRVYCGAGCPPEQENFFKNLLKIGGILVIPTTDFLWQIIRNGQTSWQVNKLLSVTFASLVPPQPDEENQTFHIDSPKPLKLTAICRYNIRNLLRRKIEHTNPRLKRRLQPRKKKRRVQKVVLPVMPEPREVHDDDEEQGADDENPSAVPEHRFDPRNYSLFSVMSSATSASASRNEASSQRPLSEEDEDSSIFMPSSIFRTIVKPKSYELVRREIDDIDPAEFHLESFVEACDAASARKRECERTVSLSHDSDNDQRLPSCSSNCKSTLSPPCKSDNEQTLPSSSTGHSSCDRKPTWKQSDVDTDSDEKSEKQGKRLHSNCESFSHYITSKYSKYMVSNIQKLPLPNALKQYVNYDRKL